MKIAFNPSTVAALTTPPNNKDITFDLRGRNIFARGVKFCGTDTNTWRDIKINNVSIGSNILDLRNGSNTTLTNTNGVVTINSTWRPVVDNLTSNSATSSLSANQGRVLAGLINGKSDLDHNHDGRYLKLTGGTLTGNLVGTSAIFSGRFYGNEDDEGIIIKPASNGYAGLILGTHSGERSVFYLTKGKPFWRYNNGSTNLDIQHPKKPGVIALTSDIPDKNSWNYDDRYYTKAESDIKYITDITTSVNKLTFTKNGSNIARDITVNIVRSQGYLTNISDKNATTKASSGLVIYNSYNQTIGTNPYSSVLSINTGGTIQIAGNWGDDTARNLYWRSQSDRNVADYPWKSWRTILDNENYSSTLDSRYYTETEVNSLLDAKLNRQNLSYGAWNPRGYHLAADYNYNGGDLSISESGGQIHVSVDGYFWQNEGQYRVLDTSDVAGLKNNLTVHQYLSNTDTTWWPLIWGGNSHNNVSDSTGAVYKSHDVLSWQTSSQTLYATKLRTINLDTQTAFFHPGNDSTLKIYSGRTQDGVSDGHIGLQTSIDNTDGQTHVYPTQWGSRCVLALQPRGGSVYIGNMPNGGNGRKLNVNGDIGLFNTGSIRDLAIGGGIYWNPNVESASDGSDAASITLVKAGVAGGTTLVLSQMNDANDTIQFKTNAAARLYHNSYPILTTQNTYVNNHKGYIYGAEITQVNNSDTVDGYHATDGRTFNGNINWGSWSNTWSDGTHTHPWYGFDHRYPNTGAYSTTISDYYGMTIKTANNLRLDCANLLINGIIYINNGNFQIRREGSSQTWVNGRNGALLRETSVAGYHTLWSLKTTDGSWDFGEYNAGSGWNNIPVLSYITDSNYNSGNNAPTYQIKFPLASGTVALINDVNNYYWANVKISASSSTTTSPTVSNLTATNSIKMGNILLEYTDEINNITNNGSLNLNCRNSGNVSLCAGGGKVGIGTRYPSHELYVMGYTHTNGFGINPYYLSDSGLLPTISPGDGYTYRCLEIGRSAIISCIIADKTYLPGSIRGVLLNFKEGFDGQLVLLKDLQNYGSGNGYFWVMPSGCKIIRADSSSILIGQNQISNTYDDGDSRFFIYSSKYSAWIEFLCS